MLEKRILCSVPVYHAVEPLPFAHFLSLSQESGRAEAAGKYEVRWLVGGPKVKTQNVRNTSCRVALDGNATHLAFIDDDMLPEPKDILERLLAHDKDIVAPLFFRSSGNFDPLVFDLDGSGEPVPMLNYPRNALFQVNGGVGTGVMLIKSRVLKAMHDPWFYYLTNSARSMDVHFCIRAISMDFEVWCDSSIIVRQMGLPNPVGEADFLTNGKVLTAR
ncbi:MAG: hypothetical protein HQL37_11370 [Alphaproteobacteria bacterium]|nr:hypothetical protein [Alphaproteobacteria bacterium]